MISENRTMRKIYIGMIILCMFLGLSSCKTNSDTESDAAKQTGNKTISDVEEAKSHNLSDKELEQIKFLIQLMRSAESTSVSTHIGEGRVLRSAKEQFKFLKALNERDKTEFIQDLFKDYIHFNEDKMTISKDNDKSVFARYSVTYIMVNYAHHGETWETLQNLSGVLHTD